MKLCVVLLLTIVTAAVVYSAPVSDIENEEFAVELMTAIRGYKAVTDIRDLIEKWVKGHYGIRKSLEGLAEIIQGKRSVQEISVKIREVFGSMSTVGHGLILLLRNVGVNAFAVFINKILGRDYVAPHDFGFDYQAQPF